MVCLHKTYESIAKCMHWACEYAKQSYVRTSVKWADWRSWALLYARRKLVVYVMCHRVRNCQHTTLL